jgi:hypothetical protein
MRLAAVSDLQSAANFMIDPVSVREEIRVAGRGAEVRV